MTFNYFRSLRIEGKRVQPLAFWTISFATKYIGIFRLIVFSYHLEPLIFPVLIVFEDWQVSVVFGLNRCFTMTVSRIFVPSFPFPYQNMTGAFQNMTGAFSLSEFLFSLFYHDILFQYDRGLSECYNRLNTSFQIEHGVTCTFSRVMMERGNHFQAAVVCSITL